jgi:hypothetical protein
MLNVSLHLHIRGKKRYWMVEDGHLEAEGDEGETLIKVYALYAGRKDEGVTSCNVKVQGSGGADGWKGSLLVYIQR